MLYVSDPQHLSAATPGGVQICTAEYRALLEAAGFELIDAPITHSASLTVRLRVRLGLDAYDRYDFRAALPRVVAALRSSNARWVAVNQVALLPLAALLKQELGQDVKIVGLSHGSESGDVAHDVARRVTFGPRHWLAQWRLGRMVAIESQLFASGIDVLLTLSDTDAHIARWLGARRTLVVPRTWNAAPCGQEWPGGVIGFVGSLHHAPNWDGLRAVLDGLQQLDREGAEVAVVGGPRTQGERLQRDYAFVSYRGALSDAQLAQEVKRWSAFINPVFWHARGASTKLATAIGWGVPIVSSQAGARGYAGVGDALVFAETPAEMAQAALKLAFDAGLRSAAARATSVLSRRSPQIGEIAAELRAILDDFDHAAPREASAT